LDENAAAYAAPAARHELSFLGEQKGQDVPSPSPPKQPAAPGEAAGVVGRRLIPYHGTTLSSTPAGYELQR